MLLPLVLVALLMMACSGSKTDESYEPVQSQRTIATVSIPAPVFSGLDQQGHSFVSTSLHGRRWIASFFFTSCQTVCPTLNDMQRNLLTEFSDKVALVSVSTDPTVDQGKTLTEYAEKYQAKPGQWWMITMPVDSMRAVSRNGFAVIDPAEPSMHTTRVVAVDENMMIKGYYDSEEPGDVALLKKWIISQ